MSKNSKDFYQVLRRRIAQWLQKQGAGFRYAQFLILAPDLFHLLTRLLFDSRVSVQDKAKLGAAIAYFVSPIDLVPEALLGPVGYVDDIALAAFVLNQLMSKGNAEIAREHWAGDGDILEWVQKILAVADEMVGSGLWAQLRKRFE